MVLLLKFGASFCKQPFYLLGELHSFRRSVILTDEYLESFGQTNLTNHDGTMLQCGTNTFSFVITAHGMIVIHEYSG